MINHCIPTVLACPVWHRSLPARFAYVGCTPNRFLGERLPCTSLSFSRRFRGFCPWLEKPDEPIDGTAHPSRDIPPFQVTGSVVVTQQRTPDMRHVTTGIGWATQREEVEHEREDRDVDNLDLPQKQEVDPRFGLIERDPITIAITAPMPRSSSPFPYPCSRGLY